MSRTNFTRRKLIAATAGFGLSSAFGAPSAMAQAVRWSTGTARPGIPLPPGAVDCHHHIYDSRWKVDPRASLRPGEATVSDYRQLMKRLGIERHVVVQPSTYGTDNSGVLDSLMQFGPSARGIAVVDPNVSDAELQRMHRLGVRGLRLNLSAWPREAVQSLATRIASLGWHFEGSAETDWIASNAEMLNALAVPVVFDHYARILSTSDPAFPIVKGLLEHKKAWIKITNNNTGVPYSARTAMAKAYVEIAPEQIVWGTDWPHPARADNDKPDDAAFVDLISTSIGRLELRRAIFSRNPERLYGF